jgi:hypothetical protein
VDVLRKGEMISEQKIQLDALARKEDEANRTDRQFSRRRRMSRLGQARNWGKEKRV